MTATVGLEGGHFFIVITRMVTKISITTTVVRFFCDQDLQSEKRQPSLGKVTVVMIKPDIHS